MGRGKMTMGKQVPQFFLKGHGSMTTNQGEPKLKQTLSAMSNLQFKSFEWKEDTRTFCAFKTKLMT